ncbi:MAG: hypothetical protein KKB51_18055 [Candidatus Riflebacteria bacterium]|nr:hypothetical protein [Candidatus Riflebacteria bacterium]
MSGKINYKYIDKIFIAEIAGYAELSLMEGLVEHFFKKLDEDYTNFVFDFSGMTLINSSALGKLLEIISEVMGSDSVRILFCSIPTTSKLGMISLGILNYVDEYASIEEALQDLKPE